MERKTCLRPTLPVSCFQESFESSPIGLRQLRRDALDPKRQSIVHLYLRQSPGCTELLTIYDDQSQSRNHLVLGELFLLLRCLLDVRVDDGGHSEDAIWAMEALDGLAYAIINRRMKACHRQETVGDSGKCS